MAPGCPPRPALRFPGERRRLRAGRHTCCSRPRDRATRQPVGGTARAARCTESGPDPTQPPRSAPPAPLPRLTYQLGIAPGRAPLPGGLWRRGPAAPRPPRPCLAAKGAPEGRAQRPPGLAQGESGTRPPGQAERAAVAVATASRLSPAAQRPGPAARPPPPRAAEQPPEPPAQPSGGQHAARRPPARRPLRALRPRPPERAAARHRHPPPRQSDGDPGTGDEPRAAPVQREGGGGERGDALRRFTVAPSAACRALYGRLLAGPRAPPQALSSRPRAAPTCSGGGVALLAPPRRTGAVQLGEEGDDHLGQNS